MSEVIAPARRKPAYVRANERPRGDKVGARRVELAEAALETLAELGYARTSLREIAQKSDFSHGVLHYYFSDKVDLILTSVRHYKSTCATRYDTITKTARTPDELVEGFLAKLSETLQSEADKHRLWYDLRSQALYDPAFHKDVQEIDTLLEAMVWRVASRYAELAGKTLTVSPAVAYALLDGLFQRRLLEFLAGETQAVTHLVDDVGPLFARIVT